MNADASPTAAALEESILSLTTLRGAASICPSEVARALHPGEGWQSLMTPVRQAALRLARRGAIDILRKGRPVAPEDHPIGPDDIKGVIRLRGRP